MDIHWSHIQKVMTNIRRTSLTLLTSCSRGVEKGDAVGLWDGNNPKHTQTKTSKDLLLAMMRVVKKLCFWKACLIFCSSVPGEAIYQTSYLESFSHMKKSNMSNSFIKRFHIPFSWHQSTTSSSKASKTLVLAIECIWKDMRKDVSWLVVVETLFVMPSSKPMVTSEALAGQLITLSPDWWGLESLWGAAKPRGAHGQALQWPKLLLSVLSPY